MKRVLVCGAGGFIGGHLVKRLKSEGCHVVGVDLKRHEYVVSPADEFLVGDLSDQVFAQKVFKAKFDEVYQLAADMGGAGFIFTGENDTAIMTNSAMINLNVLKYGAKSAFDRVFYSSSACIYPEHNQMDAQNPNCEESSAYPAAPDSEYGWEKLFSERLYLAKARNTGLKVRIGRFHNIFGDEGTWVGGREKAPAAVCRKVAATPNGGTIEIWGDGNQTRTFLYVSDCVDAILRLTRSDFSGPVNIGSEELISINDLTLMAMNIAGKKLDLVHVEGPNGVRGRASHNRLIEKKLDWKPKLDLRGGMEIAYRWIAAQVQSKKYSEPRSGKPLLRKAA